MLIIQRRVPAAGPRGHAHERDLLPRPAAGPGSAHRL